MFEITQTKPNLTISTYYSIFSQNQTFNLFFVCPNQVSSNISNNTNPLYNEKLKALFYTWSTR
jgi:hypothetical protein